MGIVWIVLALLMGYSVYRLLFDKDAERRKAYLKALLGYVVTAGLCVVAFRSGLPWLLAVIGAGYLAARGLPMLQQSKQQHSSARREATGRRTSTMTRQQALEVLGLDEKADASEVNERYRQLMRKVHPDQGGSSYLATQLNEARKVLLS